MREKAKKGDNIDWSKNVNCILYIYRFQDLNHKVHVVVVGHFHHQM